MSAKHNVDVKPLSILPNSFVDHSETQKISIEVPNLPPLGFRDENAEKTGTLVKSIKKE
jgi:hypothetical protein